MNISDLNNRIYGHKDLKEGEYANFIMESIEQQGIINLDLDNYNNKNIGNRFNEINKEIKF